MTPKPDDIWVAITQNLYPWDRKKRMLVYLWRLVPATTDSIHRPDYETMKHIYDYFIKDCQKDHPSIPAQFSSTQRVRGYPFDQNNTLATEDGRVWAKALALAAHQLKVGVKLPDKNKTEEQKGREVKEGIRETVYDEWCSTLDEIFNSALKLWEAEVKENEKAKEAGPQTLDK